MKFKSLIWIVICIIKMCLSRNHVFFLRVKYNNICITAFTYHTFFRINAIKLCRIFT